LGEWIAKYYKKPTGRELYATAYKYPIDAWNATVDATQRVGSTLSEAYTTGPRSAVEADMAYYPNAKNPIVLKPLIHVLASGNKEEIAKRGIDTSKPDYAIAALKNVIKNRDDAQKLLRNKYPGEFKFTTAGGLCYNISDATPFEVAVASQDKSMIEFLGNLVPEVKDPSKRQFANFGKCGEPSKKMDAYQIANLMAKDLRNHLIVQAAPEESKAKLLAEKDQQKARDVAKLPLNKEEQDELRKQTAAVEAVRDQVISSMGGQAGDGMKPSVPPVYVAPDKKTNDDNIRKAIRESIGRNRNTGAPETHGTQPNQ
jgi:hypothetical protein